MRLIGQSVANNTLRGLKRLSAVWIAASTLTMAPACSPNLENHGNMADAEAVQEIRAGTTTKQQVLDLLGTPSTTSVFGSENWYYVGERSSWIAFLDPDIIERRVLIIRFDKNGIVAGLDTRNEKDARQINIVGRETPTGTGDVTILRQLLGNVGRVRAPGGETRP